MAIRGRQEDGGEKAQPQGLVCRWAWDSPLFEESRIIQYESYRSRQGRLLD